MVLLIQKIFSLSPEPKKKKIMVRLYHCQAKLLFPIGIVRTEDEFMKVN